MLQAGQSRPVILKREYSGHKIHHFTQRSFWGTRKQLSYIIELDNSDHILGWSSKVNKVCMAPNMVLLLYMMLIPTSFTKGVNKKKTHQKWKIE